MRFVNRKTLVAAGLVLAIGGASAGTFLFNRDDSIRSVSVPERAESSTTSTTSTSTTTTTTTAPPEPTPDASAQPAPGQPRAAGGGPAAPAPVAPAPAPAPPAPTGPGGRSVVEGDLVLTQPGQVVENVDVRGSIIVQASNVTVRHFSARSIVDIFWNGYVNATFEDGLVDGQNGEDNCVSFGNYTLRRMELTRCVDGAKFGPSTYIYDTRIHDLWTPPGAHSDGLQSTGNAGGGPSVIAGVWLDRPLMLGDEDSPLTTITITNSYLGGGLWGGWNQATGTYPSALTVTGCTISQVLYVHPSTVWSNNVVL